MKLITALCTLVGLTAGLTAQQYFAPASRGVMTGLLDLRGARDIALGDVDGDGDLDALVGVFDDGRLQVGRHRLLLNEGPGRFRDVTDFQMPRMSVCLARQVVLTDVDGDGDLDALIAHGARSGTLINALRIDPGSLQNRLLLNDGSGTFRDASSRIDPPDLVTTALAVGDFDGDGDPDLITGDTPYSSRYGTWSGQNHYFENDGSGSFQERAGRLPVDDAAERHAAVGDIDGDGDLDVVFANGDGIICYVNDGTGRFAASPVPWPSSIEAVRLALFDQDFDGDLDCAVTTLDNTAWTRSVALLRNDGSGSFTDVSSSVFQNPARTRIFDSSLHTAADIEPLDIDADGDLDLVVAAHPHGRIFRNDVTAFHELPEAALPGTWIRNAVGGTFGNPCNQQTETPSIALAAGDLDGNGLADLFGVHSFDARVHLNTGYGTFEPVGEPGWGSDDPSDPVVGDLDGDDVPDLVVPRIASILLPDDIPLRIWLGDGFGGYRDVTATHAPPSGRLTRIHAGPYGPSPVLADFDGDGDLDLAATWEDHLGGGSWQKEVRIWMNDGAGRFTGTYHTLPAGAATSIHDLACADLDADGDLDCVVVQRSNTTSSVRLYANDGAGNFTEASSGLPQVVELHSDVEIGDVTGDGQPDLLLAATPVFDNSLWSWVGGQTRVWRNVGGLGFAAIGGLPLDDDHTWSTTLADVDADGDLDVLLANAGEHILCGPLAPGPAATGNRLWENDGSGTFTDVTVSVLPRETDRTEEIVVFDVDEDGALDLIYRNACPGFATHHRKVADSHCPPETNRVLLRRGAGYVDVSAVALPSTPDYTLASVVHDIDGDEDLDLIFESAAPINRVFALANQATQLEIPEKLRIGSTGRFIGTRRPAPGGTSPHTLTLLVGTSPANLVFPGVRGRLRLAPSSIVPVPGNSVPPGGGQTTVTFGIPTLPALVGNDVLVQGIWARPGEFRLTNALRDTIGR